MRRSGRFNRVAIVGAATTLVLGTLGTATAFALWSSAGTATAPASAGSVPTPVAPTAAANNDVVTVTLPAPPTTITIRGYRVFRFRATGQGTRIAAGGTCANPPATGGTCQETVTEAGQWQYTAQYLVGATWTSAESPRSASVAVNNGGGPQGAQNLAAQPGATTAEPAASPTAAPSEASEASKRTEKGAPTEEPAKEPPSTTQPPVTEQPPTTQPPPAGGTEPPSPTTTPES